MITDCSVSLPSVVHVLFTVYSGAIDGDYAKIVLDIRVYVGNACDTTVLRSLIDAAIGRATEDREDCDCFGNTAFVANRI